VLLLLLSPAPAAALPFGNSRCLNDAPMMWIVEPLNVYSVFPLYCLQLCLCKAPTFPLLGTWQATQLASVLSQHCQDDLHDGNGRLSLSAILIAVVYAA
jgi:hypothetical protein